MSIRDIFSNFSLHSELFGAAQLFSDDQDVQSTIMNLSGGSTMTMMVPFASVGYDPVPPVGAWVIDALRLAYYDNADFNGTPLIETFDPVTGVSEFGNELIFADGSPVTFPILGSDTDPKNVYVMINNPLCDGSDDPSSIPFHYVALAVDCGTFADNAIGVNFSYLSYRGPAELAEPGEWLTFDGSGFI